MQKSTPHLMPEAFVIYVMEAFMPKLKDKSKAALIDIACRGAKVTSTAKKYGITHQSVSKNLARLTSIKNFIVKGKIEKVMSSL